jgi:hypothetical protein
VNRRVSMPIALAVAVGAVAVPLAHAASSHDGDTSSYLSLHHRAAGAHDGYKSSYPQLHEVLTHQGAGSSRAAPAPLAS